MKVHSRCTGCWLKHPLGSPVKVHGTARCMGCLFETAGKGCLHPKTPSTGNIPGMKTPFPVVGSFFTGKNAPFPFQRGEKKGTGPNGP